MKKRILFLFIFIVVLLYFSRIIPPLAFDSNYFHIESFESSQDFDCDGVDDQSDILQNALEYIEKRPKYKSVYYANGYPDDEYGVCSDVVAIALKDAGYDLMELVYQDVLKNKEDYNIDVIDKNIDFRRVRNLLVYFENNAISLTTDLNEKTQWQGGDIVVFDEHIGIVSNKRNWKGIPLLIHHGRIFQFHYEEDLMEHYKILGHYRISE